MSGRRGCWCGSQPVAAAEPGQLPGGRVVTEPAHFVMERKMLKTIKQLVERPRREAISA
jgi:hypothetical protein